VNGAALRALPSPDQQPYSWPAVLRAALREEFRVDVYRPRPGDRVLFGPTCAVAGCPGRGANRSLGLKAKGANHSTGTMFRGYICLAHVAMWRRDGEPPIDAWVQHAARATRPRRARSLHSAGLSTIRLPARVLRRAQASLRPCRAARRSRRVRRRLHAGSDR